MYIMLYIYLIYICIYIWKHCGALLFFSSVNSTWRRKIKKRIELILRLKKQIFLRKENPRQPILLEQLKVSSVKCHHFMQAMFNFWCIVKRNNIKIKID